MSQRAKHADTEILVPLTAVEVRALLWAAGKQANDEQMDFQITPDGSMLYDDGYGDPLSSTEMLGGLDGAEDKLRRSAGLLS